MAQFACRQGDGPDYAWPNRTRYLRTESFSPGGPWKGSQSEWECWGDSYKGTSRWLRWAGTLGRGLRAASTCWELFPIHSSQNTRDLRSATARQCILSTVCLEADASSEFPTRMQPAWHCCQPMGPPAERPHPTGPELLTYATGRQWVDVI